MLINDMLSAGEIETLKNDLREFYNNFPTYTILNYYSQLEELNEKDYFKENILKYVKTTDKILDVGCGSGLYAIEFSKYAGEVIGMDISSTAIVLANEIKNIEYKRIKLIEEFNKIDLNSKKILNTRFQIGDAEKLYFTKKSFDLVLLKNVTEHLPAPIKSLNKVLEILKPSGLIIIDQTIHDIDTNINIEKWTSNLTEMKYKDTISKINFNVLKRYIKKKNLSIVEVKILYNNNLLNLLCTIFPFLKGLQVFEILEKEFFIVLKQN